MNKTLLQILLVLVAGPLLLIAAWSSLKVYQLSTARAEIKKDYSELNSLTYGLLSVNVWRDHLTRIALNRIDDFELTPKQRDTLQHEVSQLLHAVLDKADSMLEQKQTTVKGKLKKFAIKTLVNEDKIREKVPLFSETIVNEVQTPENKQTLKYLVKSKIKEFSDMTHAGSSEILITDSLLNKYNTSRLEEFNRKSQVSLQSLQEQTYFYTYIILGVVGLFVLLWWLLLKKRGVHTSLFILSVLLALVVLAPGLTAPMIEIDARLKEVNFQLIGEEIIFRDQVIFFQSKSIVDVVQILLETGKVDSMLVGILILLFSILFPVAKLLATQLYLVGDGKWRKGRLINFFAFKSGKWSMADVYVIAIFMSYIGFQGIFNNQLALLNVNTDSLMSISTNKTSLQPGFLLFICFVLFSLLLSVILKKITALKSAKA